MIPSQSQITRRTFCATMAVLLTIGSLGLGDEFRVSRVATFMVDIAPKVAYVCKDADDQKFIDLAAAHRAILLSKDKAVICMRKRLALLDAQVATELVLEIEGSVAAA